MTHRLALAALAALALAAAPIAQDNLDDLASRLQLATGEATTLAQEAAAARETLLAARAQAQAAAAALEGAEAAYIEKVAEAGAARLIAAQIAGEYAAAVKAAGKPKEPEPDPDPGAGAYWEPAPDLSGMPFSSDLPPFPEYHIPTAAECDWVVEGGVYRSTKGLPDFAVVGMDSAQAPYDASHRAGHEKPIRFGVVDTVGRCRMDYWASTRASGEASPLSIEFVGLSDIAEIGSPTWRVDKGQPNVVPDHVAFYNIGIRGGRDSFLVRANGGVDTLILDGCWWLPVDGYTTTLTGPSAADSGMHIDNWKTLVWRRHRWRGTRPEDHGIRLSEHSAYLKACVGDPSSGDATWIVENNLFGGNRTGFQIRPDVAINARPACPVVIAYNYADGVGTDGYPAGYGWNHSSSQGGAALTVWSSPDAPVYIFRNRIEDARYGCVMVGGQGPNNNHTNAAGFVFGDVWIHDNTLGNDLRGRIPEYNRRAAIAASAVERLRISSTRLLAGSYIELDGRWAMERHAIQNGVVKLSSDMTSARISDYMDGVHRPLTDAEKQSLAVPSTSAAVEPVAPTK